MSSERYGGVRQKRNHRRNVNRKNIFNNKVITDSKRKKKGKLYTDRLLTKQKPLKSATVKKKRRF